MDKEGENVIVCGIALGLAVLGWAVSRKWGRKDWQKGAAVIAAAACLGLLSVYMELQTDEDPEKGLLRRENGEGDYEADLRMYVDGAKKAEAYTVHVPEQELTKQEEQAYLRAAEEELIKEFPGDNESVNCIRDAVVIREEYQEGEPHWKNCGRTGRGGGAGECAGHSDMWKIQMCTGVLYLRVSQTVRRGRALPEGDFRKDCATAAGGGSRQTFSAG